ncbi:MAG: WG repeat-containing protein, partial [Acidobacteria bacterium]|nr:WG repeat-containing protein [Acidobacteriota bacterium]
LAVLIIDDKYGYINSKGEVVIEPQFDDARSFRITK